MMHRFLIAVALLLVMAAVPALAQTPGKVIPQFIPASGWTVKPALMVEDRNLTNIRIPCMMMVEYDNGFTLRLSGGGSQLLAMAIDFRQEVFTRGKQYNASFMIDGMMAGSSKATAFDDNVLIFNARPMNGFYQQLQAAQKLTLNVEGNQFHFTLGNIAEAFGRLEKCYAGDHSQSSASKPMPVGLHNAPMKDSALPQTQDSPDWQDTRENVSRMPHDTSMPDSQPRRAKPAQVWRANAGDTIKETLMVWSDQADVELDWQATASGIVVTDIAMTGHFEEAVQSLLAQNAAATGLQADLIGGGVQRTSKSPQPIMPVSVEPQKPRVSRKDSVMGLASSSRWSVPAGSNLRRVLEVWSQKEGIELFWQANQAFAVKNNVSNNGGYTQAVEELLSQYVNDSIRPIAQLNTDPNTGRRILIVQSSRVL